MVYLRRKGPVMQQKVPSKGSLALNAQLQRSWSRFREKPRTFVTLGLILAVALTGAIVLLFPTAFLEERSGLPSLHLAVRVALAVALAAASVLTMTAMAYAAAYKIHGLKPIGLALTKLGPVLKTSATALAVLILPALLVIPGALLKTRFSLMLPVIVAEKKTGFTALKRSSDLVRGHTRQLLWNLLLVGLAMAISVAAMAAIAATLAHFVETGPMTSGLALAAAKIMTAAVPAALFSLLFMPFLALFLQVSYENLIRTHQGPIAATVGQRFLVYKMLSVLGILIATGAGAAGIISHPELTVDRTTSGDTTASGKIRRGPADTDTYATAGREAEQSEKEPTAKDRDWQRYQDVSAIRMALQLYANDNGGYPETLDGLIPKYIEEVPDDPTYGHHYRYAFQADTFELGFMLEEGIRALGSGNHILTPKGFDPGGTSTPSGNGWVTAKPDTLVFARDVNRGGGSPSLPDHDGDGISDDAERDFGTDPQEADSDGDGLSDPDELEVFGTDPADSDSDDDALTDGTEVSDGTDPTVFDDATGDGAAAADSDGDGLADGYERAVGTDLADSDSDDDGIADGDEVLVFGTDPLNADTDGDGYGDSTEINAGTDPLSATKRMPSSGGGGSGTPPPAAASSQPWTGRAEKFGLHQPTLATLGFWHPSLPGLY